MKKFTFEDLLCCVNEVAEEGRDVFLIQNGQVEYCGGDYVDTLFNALLEREDKFQGCVANEFESELKCRFLGEEEFELHFC